MIHNLNFVCRPSKVNRKGIAPVEMTISINGKRVFMSLPIKVSPEQFLKDSVSKKPNEVKDIMQTYTALVQNAIADMLKQNIVITAQSVKDYLNGKHLKVYTLNDMFRDYLVLLGLKIDVSITLDCWLKYERVSKRFLKEYDGNKDINSITTGDILLYMGKINKEYKNSTAHKHMTMCKSFFTYAVKNGKLKTNPFADVKFDRVETDVTTFTDAEYKRMLNKKITNERLDKVRDFFIFASNSGMAYTDIIKLSKDDFIKRNGKVVVNKLRQKTKVEFYSVILPDGIKVLEKYDYDLSNLKLSNQKLNTYANELADICKVTSVDSLHCHLCRHYYITKLLKQGVPVSVVQKIAGHKNIAMTQHYTHLLKDDIINAVNKVFK